MSARAGSYGVVATTGWKARAIQWGTGSWANHAYIPVSDTHCVEAQPGGARLTPLSDYDGCRTAYNDAQPLSDAQRAVIVAAALACLGTPYGWWDIVAQAWACSRIPTPAFVWHRVERQDRLICSQLVARCYARAGVPLTRDGQLSCEVTPAQLAAEIAALPACDQLAA